uniref:Uncharacterized protein n=1 Tax=Arundo donax TaxID=35708 RepID=A0A0A8ZZF4_ARUDO
MSHFHRIGFSGVTNTDSPT